MRNFGCALPNKWELVWTRTRVRSRLFVFWLKMRIVECRQVGQERKTVLLWQTAMFYHFSVRNLFKRISEEKTSFPCAHCVKILERISFTSRTWRRRYPESNTNASSEQKSAWIVQLNRLILIFVSKKSSPFTPNWFSPWRKINKRKNSVLQFCVRRICTYCLDCADLDAHNFPLH